VNLANAYYAEGQYEQAEKLFSQAVEITRRVMGPEHSFTLVSMNNLAAAYEFRGKYTEAEALFSQSVKIGQRVLGPEHPFTLSFPFRVCIHVSTAGQI